MSNTSRAHSVCRNNPAFLLGLVLPFLEPPSRPQPARALTDALATALWPTPASLTAACKGLLTPEF
jgi:hypothetical protein